MVHLFWNPPKLIYIFVFLYEKMFLRTSGMSAELELEMLREALREQAEREREERERREAEEAREREREAEQEKINMILTFIDNLGK